MSLEFKVNKYHPDKTDQIITQIFYTADWEKHKLVLESSIPYNHIYIYDKNEKEELSMTLSESQTTMILSALMCGKKGAKIDDIQMGTASGFLDVDYHISVTPVELGCRVHIWDTVMEAFGYPKSLIDFTISKSELADIIVPLKWTLVYYAENTDVWNEREAIRKEIILKPDSSD